MRTAILQNVVGDKLLGHYHGNPHVSAQAALCTLKNCRGDTHDRVRALVDVNGFADDRGIAAEMHLPQTIADDHYGSPAGLRAFDRQESSAENRMHIESVKII